MTKTRQRVLRSTSLIALLVVTAFTFAASRKLRSPQTTGTTTAEQNPSNLGRANRRVYVRRGLVSPKLAWHLNALGDRLEKPGKERVSVVGTLNRNGDSQSGEVVAVLEFPERLSLTIQSGVQTRVITFDGAQAKSVGNPLELRERDLIETLVYGTAEHFFMTQMQGQATRFLGARFRMDDGANANYSGPFYDIYQVADQINTSVGKRHQERLYYFNSDTLLLERVSYQINRDGSEVKVEEMIGDWQKEQGQQVARRIERFENGKSVFVLSLRSAGLAPELTMDFSSRKRNSGDTADDQRAFVFSQRQSDGTLRGGNSSDSFSSFMRVWPGLDASARLSVSRFLCVI